MFLSHLSETQKGALFAFIGFSAFAWGDVVFKHLGERYSIFMIGFFAAFFALIILTALATVKPGLKKALKTNHLRLHIVRGALLLVQFLCIIYAFQYMSLAKFYALIFAAPMIAILLALVFLKERASIGIYAAVLVGLGGVMIILRPGMIPIDVASIATLCAAFLFASSNIITRFIGNKDHPYAFAIYTELVILPVTAILMIPHFVIPTLGDSFLFVLTGVFSAMGLIFIAKGFSHAPASIAAPFHYVQMLWGVVLGYLVFGDRLDLWTAIGGAVIIASGIWVLRHSNAPPPQKYPPPLQ